MKRAASQSQNGIVLVELLLVLAITAIMTVAIGYAFVAALDVQRTHVSRQSQVDTVAAMQRRITKLLQGAVLADDSADETTYMLGQASEYGDTGTMGCDELIFSTVSEAVPAAAVNDTDTFEEQHEKMGCIGGVAEVRLGVDPIGEAGDRSGLFIRVQRPSDADTTQGGRERVLCADIQRIGFQFWDGLEWLDTWDTVSVSRRLPAAVRVSYTLTGDKDKEVHTFIVRIPGSDVDADDPVETETTS